MDEEGTAQVLVQACLQADFNASTGECAAPFYTLMPSGLPTLSADEGLQIAAAIAGVWTLGLIARLIIRAGQSGRYNH